MGKKGRRLPEVLTPQEQDSLLAQPDKGRRQGFRNFCMVRIMLNLGLRAGEVLNLKVKDIDWISGKLMVRQGKGNKDRALKLNPEDLDLLRRWIEERPVESDYLFPTTKGGRITDRYLRQMVKHLAHQAGIGKDIHPHTLRHTFATDFYRETRNLRMTQKVLGHENISTTEIYTHISDPELEEALSTFRTGSPNAPHKRRRKTTKEDHHEERGHEG